MKLYTLDVTCLESARNGLQQPFSPLQLALGRLVSEADKLRGQAPESVVHKKLRPVSGDPHDYYSLGTYWWPNCSAAKFFALKRGVFCTARTS